MFLSPLNTSKMHQHFQPTLVLLLFMLLLSSSLQTTQAFDCKQQRTKTILVDQSGRGDTESVQDAINDVPMNNDAWIKIHVKSGTYLERITISKGQNCIILEGEGRKKTFISSNDHTNTDYSATLTVRADNFVAKFISFVNSYNLEEHYLERWYDRAIGNVVPAEAALIRGDKNAFYDCGFIGYQDTISDQSGRHYLNKCYIEGAVDFIYGSGQSFYENCVINVTGYGFIAAQGRNAPEDPSGFVFEGCHVVGGGPTYLGRAYRQYSRVVYNSCTIDANVVSQGWDAWQEIGHEDDFEFVESNCNGRNYDESKRPSWVKILDSSATGKYSREAFINQDGWIEKLT